MGFCMPGYSRMSFPLFAAFSATDAFVLCVVLYAHHPIHHDAVTICCQQVSSETYRHIVPQNLVTLHDYKTLIRPTTIRSLTTP